MVTQPEPPAEIRGQTPLRIIPPPEQVSIAIPLGEWDSLVNRVESCRVSVQWWSVAYSIAFGAGITAGLSIAPIAVSDLPALVFTLYAVIGAVGLSSGVILVLAQKQISKGQESQIDQLLSEMNRTRNRYIPPENPS